MITRHSELLSPFSTTPNNILDLNKVPRPLCQKLAFIKSGSTSSQHRLQKTAISNRNYQTLAQKHTFAVNKHKTKKSSNTK